MNQKIVNARPNGDFDLEITCETCGKPITVTNEYGMYCENLCGMDADRERMSRFEKFISFLGKHGDEFFH